MALRDAAQTIPARHIHGTSTPNRLQTALTRLAQSGSLSLLLRNTRSKWARLEGRELPSAIAERVVVVHLTDKQFKMLGKAENVHDAALHARSEGRKFPFMDGMGSAGCDKGSAQFFIQMQRKYIPALERKLQNLMEKKKSRDFEMERWATWSQAYSHPGVPGDPSYGWLRNGGTSRPKANV